jgi:threonine dehydrogenase-like Zn-dependent dehydrogenase
MLNTMRALVRDGDGVMLAMRPSPTSDVVVEVAYAGVCRSDLAVIDGSIAVEPGRVVGHELAGWAGGEPVTVIPFEGARWLGIDRDGAFADRVSVPAPCVLPLPRTMSLVHGAYVEPVAAALGVLGSIKRDDRVLVAGAGRIAELTRRVVTAFGATLVDDAADVVIEHDGRVSLSALRDGGTLVLKTRARRSIELDAGELVARDLTVRGASHGSFTAAIDWLHTGRIVIDDLLAPPRPLEDFAQVLADARASETAKQMFAIGAR